MEEFLDGMEVLLQQYYPASWKYRQDRHAASCYLAMYAPEKNYIYKYSPVEAFARHVEFGKDIGSGNSFKMSYYYELGDIVVTALKEHPELLRKHKELLDEPILPDGIPVSRLMLGGWGSISKQEGGAHGASRFLDPDPGDNTIQYLMLRSFDMPLTKDPAVVQFTDLKYMNTETEEAVILYEGKWRFRFEVDYEDSSIVLGNNETFVQEEMLFTVKEVRISPIAIRISYEVNSEVQWSDAPSGRLPEEDRRQQERYMENVSILLVKKDGTIIDMSLSGGSIQPKDGKTNCIKGDVLPEIVPLTELDRVIVGGVEYPLP